MAKGYWIPHLDVTDPEGYKAYMAATPEAHRKYTGPRAGAGRQSGGGGGQRAARATWCANSRTTPPRSPATARRNTSARSRCACRIRLADFVIIEGYDGVQPQPPATPPAAAARKGYWIAHVDVTDPEGYKAYMAANAGLAQQISAGASWCAAARSEVVEGRVRARTVVLEFPSYEVALACYRSPDYQAAAALAQRQGRLRSRHRRGLRRATDLNNKNSLQGGY